MVGGAFFAGRQTAPGKTISIERTKLVDCDPNGAPVSSRATQPRADILSVQGARQDAESQRPKFKAD